jgi:hypothetical protein
MADNGKKKLGRPVELTPDLVVKAASLAGEMFYVETASALLGISKDTFYRWIRRGSRERRRRERGLEPIPDETSFMDFSDAIQKAMAEGEQGCLSRIKAASASSWQSAAWLLERAHPERWSLERNELRRLKKKVRRLAKEQASGIDHPQGVDDEV